MAGFNSCTILGNIGRDPEIKYLPSGTAVCNFSVAVTRRWGSGEQRQEKTQWFRVNVFGKQAEIASQYVRKGGQILVQGTIEASAYLDKSGQPQVSLDLRADNFQLVGARTDGQGGQGGGQGGGDYGDYGGGGGGSNVDEIPF